MHDKSKTDFAKLIFVMLIGYFVVGPLLMIAIALLAWWLP